jgi:hypothetical protein
VRITATVRAVDMSDEQRNAEMLSREHDVQLDEDEDNGYTTSSRSRRATSRSPKRTSATTSSSTRNGATTSPGESSAVAVARHNATAYEGGRHAYRYAYIYIYICVFTNRLNKTTQCLIELYASQSCLHPFFTHIGHALQS